MVLRGAASMKPVEIETTDDEPPPFLRRWDRVYAAVLLYLALLIAILYLITWLFEPSHV